MAFSAGRVVRTAGHSSEGSWGEGHQVQLRTGRSSRVLKSAGMAWELLASLSRAPRPRRRGPLCPAHLGLPLGLNRPTCPVLGDPALVVAVWTRIALRSPRSA